MASNNTCYDETGNVVGDTFCGLNNLLTCCGSGWDCLSNGLCRQHGTTSYSQGTCANSSYQGCLAFCDQSRWAFALCPCFVSGLTTWAGRFDGFTEVSHCSSGNSWCCAGAAGQGVGGTDCCDTNLTTVLEPYPFSTVSAFLPSSLQSIVKIFGGSKWNYSF